MSGKTAVSRKLAKNWALEELLRTVRTSIEIKTWMQIRASAAKLRESPRANWMRAESTKRKINQLEGVGISFSTAILVFRVI